jgi:translation initiation factor 2 alpha subunit (eIF-2alpha)
MFGLDYRRLCYARLRCKREWEKEKKVKQLFHVLIVTVNSFNNVSTEVAPRAHKSFGHKYKNGISSWERISIFSGD